MTSASLIVARAGRLAPPGAALLVSLAAAAAAQTPPRVEPSRDVQVVYAVGAATPPARQHAAWQVATRRQRVDAPDGRSFILVDGKAGTVAMVNTITKTVQTLPTGPNPLKDPKAAFTKLATLTIAGQSCTEWDVTPPPGSRAARSQVCLTDDGVPLSVRNGAVQRVRALSVVYAPSDPALFTVPAGFAEPKD